MIQPLNEQFTRMQKLAGIQSVNKTYDKIVYTKKHDALINFFIKEYLSTHKQTLLENQLTEASIKNFISAVKDNFSKKQLPKLNSFLKALTFTKKPAETLAALSALRNAGIDLKDKKELAIVFDVLKNESSLKEEAKLVTVNGEEGYYIDQPTDEEGKETIKIFVTKKEYEEIQKRLTNKSSGVRIIGPLRKFLTTTFAGKGLTGLLALGTAFVGLADDVGNFAQTLGADIEGDDAASQETIRQLAKAGISDESINDFLDDKFSVDAGGQSAAVIDDVEQALSDDTETEDQPTDLGDLETDNPDLTDATKQGLDIDNSENQTVNFIKFKNGSSQLDGNDVIKISQENNDIVKILKNNQNYSETVLGVSSNTGDNANVDDQGGDLNLNRANNTAEAILQDIESQLKEDGIKYTRSGNTIELEDGGTYELKIGGGNDVDKLTKIDRTDDTATQSAIRVGEVGEKDTPVTPPNPTTLLGYDPLFATYGDKKEKPADEKTPKTSGKSNKSRTTLPPLDMSDDTSNKKAAPIKATQIKQDVTNLSRLNRNGQIAMVLARMSPKLNIFTQLGKDTITSLSDNDFNKIQDSNASETAKKLAKLIPNIRKSPDAFLKKVSDLTGIELAPRAKAIATKPGASTQAQITQVTETQVYLQEAAIDDLFNELGITPEEIKTNRIEIIALLGSMFAKEGNTNVSILDPKKLNKQEQKQLQGLGFTPQAGGNYVFLAPGQNKAQTFDKLQDKNKIQPDTDRVGNTIEKRPTLKTLLSRIDTADEFRDLTLSILNQIDPQLIKDKTKVKSVLFSLRNRIQEVELKDVSITIKNILKDSTLKNLLQRINTVEEAIQLIIREIIPLLSPKLLGDKTKLKNAIISAANKYSTTAKK